MSKTIFIFLLTGFLLSCQNNSGRERTINSEDTADLSYNDSLTNELKEIYQLGHINGFSVALVNQDKTIYQKGFGYSDVKIKKEYTENTIQNIASISKTFIGVALLKAQEMGKLDLNDPVNKFLPFEVKNPFYPEDTILIRHLASHTSTLMDTDYYYEKSYVLKNEVSANQDTFDDSYLKFNAPDTHMPMIDFMKMVLSNDGEWYKKDGFLNNQPGDAFRYSNVGATLAAVLLENATGESFDLFTSKHILKPLDMSSTGWSFDDIDMTLHTKLYSNPDTEIPFYSLITYPDGGLLTSVSDLTKYLNELIKGYSGEGKLLSAESYKELFTRQLKIEKPSGKGEPNEFNEGVFMSLKNGLIGHSGGDPGVSTFMFFRPDSKVGRILLVNTDFDAEGGKQYQSILDKLVEYEDKLNR